MEIADDTWKQRLNRHAHGGIGMRKSLIYLLFAAGREDDQDGSEQGVLK